MTIQHLRSSTANKRPTPAAMSDGQIAVNTNTASPGLFFKDSAGALIKVGPVHVGTTAPNASPASGGETGNTVGEQWLDTAGGTYVFKVWDGSAWRSESGTFVDVNGDVMTGALGIIAGSAGSPGLYFSGDTNTGLYSPGADQVAISTGGSGRLFVDASGRVGVGTTSPRHNLSIGDTAITSTASPDTIDLGGTFSNTAGANLKLRLYWDGTTSQGFGISASQIDYVAASNAAHVFYRGTSEAVRIDASSRLLIGTSSAVGTGNAVVIKGTSGVSNASIYLGNTANASVLVAGNTLGFIEYGSADGGIGAQVLAAADGTWSSTSDCPTRLVFSTTADGASSPTERMRIDNAGSLIYGTSTSPGADILSGTGFYYQISTGLLYVRSDGSPVAAFNRGGNDGTLVEFKQDQTIEGTISVSGTTVSYNGAHLSRWSQLPSGAERTEILRGSVLSNIDEMCEWGEEGNEQLNRMKVSDVEGDKNVSGVFQAWDDDDDTYTNDFYCAMTGDFIIRIGAGVTVDRGDLLMSAGDGTAKPQDDDIIRSKTIAKVTSTNVSCTYEDGSYCVPCVLMAC